MSQQRLANLLGVTFQQIQKYENGVNRLSASRLFEIAAALEMSVCDFFEGLPSGGKGDAVMQSASARPAGSDELVRLFAAISSAKARRRVVDLGRTMAADESGLVYCFHEWEGLGFAPAQA